MTSQTSLSHDAPLKKVDKYQFSPSSLIGSGSYASVYKGEDRFTGQVVAIKVINKVKIEQEEYLMNGLLQEIEIIKKLDSKYIVKLIDVLETKNNYYLIQEYCDLGDFRCYLNAKGRLSQQEANEILVQVLSGFLELLKHGIIHRDLKPENILIATDVNNEHFIHCRYLSQHQPTQTNSNTLIVFKNGNGSTGSRVFKLADFGFSRTVDNFRRELLNSLVGTPLYMSPQILMYQKYTSKSDIWSIGLIFYEMLYGRMPWSAETQYQLVEMIRNQPVKWVYEDEVEEDDGNRSQASVNFIYKCLQIEETKRISWDEIYAHELFEDHFAEFLQKHQMLEDKALYLINNLRLKIHSTDTDLLELFHHFDLTNDSKLDIKEFELLMKSIDKELNREEIEFIFNKFDSDGDNRIDFHEFQQWLQENNVRLESLHNSQDKRRKVIDQQLDEEIKQVFIQQQAQAGRVQKRASMVETGLANHIQLKRLSLPEQPTLVLLENKEKNSDNSSRPLTVEERAMLVLGKFRLIIDQYQIDLRELFNRYDKSHSNSLSFGEFTRMIKKIDDTLSQEEAIIAFKMFDQTDSGKISFEQFIDTIQEISKSVIVQIKLKKQENKPKDKEKTQTNYFHY